MYAPDDSLLSVVPTMKPPQARILGQDVHWGAGNEARICRFFAQKVQEESPDRVLANFASLFIEKKITTSSPTNTDLEPDLEQALYDLIILDKEDDFIYVLSRSCFILVQYWLNQKQYDAIQALLELFPAKTFQAPQAISLAKRRLDRWLCHFRDGENYQTIQIVLNQYTGQQGQRWSDRYVMYLLAAQAINASNPKEQREVVDRLYQQLKQQYKFKLAVYLAHCQTPNPGRKSENPTLLDGTILQRIQTILVKQHQNFSYQGLANIFLKQTEGMFYEDFKYSLNKYLFYSLSKNKICEWLSATIANHISPLYSQHDRKVWDSHLLLRTSNRLIDYLLHPDWKTSTHPFSLMAGQDNYLILTIILLKIIFICKNSYKHLISSVATLLRHYEGEAAEDCQWLIDFLEVLTVVLILSYDAIYSPLRPQS